MLTSESAAPGVHKRFRCLLALAKLAHPAVVLVLLRVLIPRTAWAHTIKRMTYYNQRPPARSTGGRVQSVAASLPRIDSASTNAFVEKSRPLRGNARCSCQRSNACLKRPLPQALHVGMEAYEGDVATPHGSASLPSELQNGASSTYSCSPP